jgi:signal transduction histidine kinase
MGLLSHIRECYEQLNELERDVVSMREKLDQAVRWHRRFAADASHELRTPVAGLRAELEEAQLNPGDTNVGILLERTLRDVDRLQAIVVDLHLIAELEEASLSAEGEPVDLADLVRTVVSKRADVPEIKLELEHGVTVDAVPAKIRRLLAELLDNAQRHAEHTVQVEVRRMGDKAELSVIDDGQGIPEADRERIFTEFARLDSARSRDQGGTGLGLAIVYNIVDAHKGSIDVEDSILGGARFVVRLPLADLPEKAPLAHGLGADRG